MGSSIRSLVVVALASTIVSCGADGPNAADSRLLGSWEYRGTDMVQTVLENVRIHLLERGVDPEVAEAEADHIGSELESFSDGWSETFHFNPDFTYEGSLGDRGSWSVDGDHLTLESAVEDLTVDFKYSIAAGDLAFILSKEQCLLYFEQSLEIWSEEEQESFDLLFEEGDLIRIFYRRQ